MDEPEAAPAVPAPDRTDRLRVVALTLAGAVFALNAYRYRFTLLDDAYISFRYARQLVDGHGLVFNVGERVEGYTNFAWVMLCALVLKLGLEPATVLALVSLACAAVLVFATDRLERASGARGVVPAVVWLLPLETLGYWSWTTMETMAFTAVFAAALASRCWDGGVRSAAWDLRDPRPHTADLTPSGSRWVARLLFVLLALLRPDGGLLFALSTGAFLLVDWLEKRPGAVKQALVDGLVFGALFGSYFLWRWRYYGEMLPNTFQAKVTGGVDQWLAGLATLGVWAQSQPLHAAALLLLPALLATRLRGALLAEPRRLAIAFVALGYIVYVVSVGGDWMPFHRFFLPVLGLTAITLNHALRMLLDPGPVARTRLAVATAMAVLLACNRIGVEPYRAFVAHQTTVVGLEVGSFLAARVPNDESIAVNMAGSLPYNARVTTIDMLGLTDAAIAHHPIYVTTPGWAGHRRGWGDYVLSRKPLYVQWYNSGGLDEPHYLGDHQLADNPYFRFFYQQKRFHLPAPPEPRPTLFVGTPFGQASSVAPDLGVRYEVGRSPFAWTRAHSSPVTVVLFERRRDRDALWPLQEAAGKDLPRFLHSVAQAWATAPVPEIDLAARRQVDMLAARAAARAQAGDRQAAKVILSEAVPLNRTARSPLVYAYVANLAVLEGDLFLAVHGTQEALRLDPHNGLYFTNLQRLLQLPFAAFKKDAHGR